MQIDGIVSGGIDILNDSITYDVINEDQIYHIWSKDNQAVKDAIFIREGQYISIDGERINECILAKRSQIDITRIGK